MLTGEDSPTSPTTVTTIDHEDSLQQNSQDIPEQEPTISLHALTGLLSVIILIDTGSTHNFINNRIMKNINYTPQSTQALAVMVADGTNILSTIFARVSNGQ